MESPLVGILLVSETNSQSSHLGLVNIPHLSRSNQTLNDFRNLLTSSLTNLPTLNFVFVTPNGWEISAMMESTVALGNVISSDGVIKVRISYTKPKYGITIEGHSSDKSNIPAGFLFCDSDINIVKLRNEIKEQLPSLYQFLLTVKFAFLDLNGWPIGRQQEKVITVLEVAAMNVVRIRCSRPQPQVEDSQHSIDYSRPSSIENQLGHLDIFSSSILQPIAEIMDCDDSALEKSLAAPDMTSLHKMTTSGSFEILISYVHTEASSYAVLLKTALEEHGYSVFIDVQCIQGGTDWQDALNDAISNCSLFLPLITPQYGQTLWTNREVKLADVLGKVIIPLNFLSSWPPKCLAIQFATTQFVSGLKGACETGIPTDIDYAMVLEAAANISSRYSAEKISSGQSFEIEESTESIPSTLSREDTVLITDDALSDKSSSTSMYLPDSPLLLRRKTNIRSYASTLPTAIDASVRESITKSRDGKPLIVISCAPQQKEFSHNLADDLKLREYETWCSCDIDPEQDDEDNARVVFQQKADEAGAVIFILSEEFEASSFCEQQVYYCEQRKRIIPVIYKPIQLPSWMAMLIGTSAFISCQSVSFKTAIFERIETLFNPQKADNELKQILKQKIDLANMCSTLSEQLPKGKLVYVSGGTQFYSKNGKKICEALGEELAKDDEIVVISGGFYGVGETVSKSFYEERLRLNKPHGVCHVVAVKDKEDKSSQTRQNSDLTFSQVPFGDTLFFGDSVRQREMLTPKVIDLCILIEGGPGAAFEAQQFVWNSNRVIPVKVSGGAAGGLFNVPSSIFDKPPGVRENDWSILADSNSTPAEIASALFKIVQAVKNPPTSARSRLSSTGDQRLKKKVSIGRSDTMPCSIDDCVPSTSHELKRTMSEKRNLTRKHKLH